MKHWPALNPPTGWLVRDGSPISRTAYAALFTLLGTTYGSGDGSTTFNLPDDRGVVLAGYKSGDSAFGTFGGTTGSKDATLVAHGHGLTDPGHGHGLSDPGHGHGVSDPGHYHNLMTGSGEGSSFPVVGNNGLGYTNTPSSFVTNTKGTGISIAGAGTGISIAGAGTGISISNSGSAATNANIQPSRVYLPIIKY
jgi:hypothetical protein